MRGSLSANPGQVGLLTSSGVDPGSALVQQLLHQRCPDAAIGAGDERHDFSHGMTLLLMLCVPIGTNKPKKI
jgi:hypothetical protein